MKVVQTLKIYLFLAVLTLLKMICNEFGNKAITSPKQDVIIIKFCLFTQRVNAGCNHFKSLFKR